MMKNVKFDYCEVCGNKIVKEVVSYYKSEKCCQKCWKRKKLDDKYHPRSYYRIGWLNKYKNGVISNPK